MTDWDQPALLRRQSAGLARADRRRVGRPDLPRPALQLQRHLQRALPREVGRRIGRPDHRLRRHLALEHRVGNRLSGSRHRRAPSSSANCSRRCASSWGQNDMMAYLTMMAQRMGELHRVLKPTGSVYLHCDPTASHYLKLLLDAVFGADNFQNEITWKRTTAHNDPNRYGRVMRPLNVLCKVVGKDLQSRPAEITLKLNSGRYRYSDENGPYRAENLTAPHSSPTRTVEWRGVHPGGEQAMAVLFGRTGTSLLGRADPAEARRTSQRKDGYKSYLSEAPGAVPQDIWTDIGLAPTSSERLGYPTQKPEALLERIVNASSDEGDVVLDPFCGCGTAVVVAERMKRRWIGIDITHLAISLMKHRLSDTFGSDLSDYHVIGLAPGCGERPCPGRGRQERRSLSVRALGAGVDRRPAQRQARGGFRDRRLHSTSSTTTRARSSGSLCRSRAGR